MARDGRGNAYQTQYLLETLFAQGEAMIQEGGLYALLWGLILTVNLRGSVSEGLTESVCRVGNLFANGVLLNNLCGVLQHTLWSLFQIKTKLAQIRLVREGKQLREKTGLEVERPDLEEERFHTLKEKMEENAHVVRQNLPYLKWAWWVAIARTLAGLARV